MIINLANRSLTWLFAQKTHYVITNLAFRSKDALCDHKFIYPFLIYFSYTRVHSCLFYKQKISPVGLKLASIKSLHIHLLDFEPHPD